MDMDFLIQKVKELMDIQTEKIKESVIKNVAANINQKLNTILDENKNLKLEVKHLQDNGKIAYVKGDKLIVKAPREDTRDKRKRNSLDSPTESPNQTQVPKKLNKTSILDYMARGRLESMGSEKPKNN
ncbi:Endonuclease-reverse transcriptase [Operophtera brumata]|uniref:Endonuclease-reverse transcriptase n=1 Tax=Operophtera brumata TaxID=104452 RepID=A0A0L7LC69_OPEBR|nr:Endonuclease-reverse transcriptase [Operophtera brumata]